MKQIATATPAPRHAIGPHTVIPRDPPGGSINVFTYGTLRPSLYPAVVDRFNLTPVGRGVLYGHYAMLHLGHFPGLVETPVRTHPDAGAAIVGEVVQVTDLSLLDRYEGYPSLYMRREVEIILDDNRRVTSWVYIYNGGPASGKPVPTGDWADMVGPRH